MLLTRKFSISRIDLIPAMDILTNEL